MSTTKPHYLADPQAIIPQGDSYLIKPQGLNIVWGNDERYWKIPAVTKEINKPVELVQVSWLEVTGQVKLKAGNKYVLTFDVGLVPDAFGWRDIQVFLMAKVGKKGKYKWIRAKLNQDQNKETVTIPADSKLIIDASSGTADDNGTTDTTLHFGMYEVWSGKWKGGLKIYNAKVTAII